VRNNITLRKHPVRQIECGTTDTGGTGNARSDGGVHIETAVRSSEGEYYIVLYYYS